ncbi:MAG: VCBS repeat-containing protein, partial [Planctomycetota bacterium]
MLAGASAAQTPALFPTRAFDAPGVYAADLPFFDVDGDGRDDAIGSQQYGTLPGALRWSRALPDATFAAPQPIGAVIGIAIAFVDADGDGDRDVYTQAGYSSSEYTCWRNDGGGVYVALTTVIVPGAGSTWAAIAHLDADPWPDLVVVAAQLPFPVDRLTWVYRGLPGAALSAPVQVGPHEPDSYAFTRVIDVDGQNGLDVLVASHLVPPYACLNDGAGNFGAAVSIPGPLGAAELLDANADGRADLLVDPDGTGPLRLSVCLSNFPAPFGAPIPLPTTQAGPIPRALDANGDAFPDVWYGTQSGGAWPTCQIFYGSSSGHYTASPTFPFFALDARFDDLDGDGLPELLTTGSSLSVTAGNFGSLAPWERVLQPPISDYGLDASDLDADGRADLVFSRTGHWLRVAMGAAGGQFHELAVG